jgi:DNA-3-methyladenine glycosylase II
MIESIIEQEGSETVPAALDGQSLDAGLRHIAARDKDLARIIRKLGRPPVWEREQGFPTLINIILEQQVSLASAKAAFDRLLATISPLTPEGFLLLDDSTLRVIGFSRQKTAYGRNLARAIVEGSLDIESLAAKTDSAVRSNLIRIKGIGLWTADIYLLRALLRPDIWPKGDLALLIAYQKIKGLELRPTPDELDRIAERWRPWRAVAARVLWNYYLSPTV